MFGHGLIHEIGNLAHLKIDGLRGGLDTIQTAPNGHERKELELLVDEQQVAVDLHDLLVAVVDEEDAHVLLALGDVLDERSIPLIVLGVFGHAHLAELRLLEQYELRAQSHVVVVRLQLFLELEELVEHVACDLRVETVRTRYEWYCYEVLNAKIDLKFPFKSIELDKSM